MNNQNLKTYSIIKFINSTNDAGKPVVDLVPTSWLLENIPGELKTLYPPPPYFNMKSMVKNLSRAGLNWQEYPVELLATTDHVPRQLRRNLPPEIMPFDSSTPTLPQFSGPRFYPSPQSPQGHERGSVSDSEVETPTKNTRRRPLPSLKKKSGNSNATSGRDADLITAVVKEIRKDILPEILEEVGKSKRSTNHEMKIKKSLSDCQSTLESFIKKQGGEAVTNKIAQFEKAIGVKMPCADMESFVLFNKKLEDQEVFDDFVLVLQDLWIPPSKLHTLTKSVTAVLVRYMTKTLAIKYSSQGKGKTGKLNFSGTNLYKALECAAVSKANRTSTKDLILAVGTVLANARDWDGGRLKRRNERKSDKSQKMSEKSISKGKPNSEAGSEAETGPEARVESDAEKQSDAESSGVVEDSE